MPMPTAKPKIAISACLMGFDVRYNGGHKESQLCSQVLSDYFDFVPVCPEVAIGLGIPRQPIRLVGDPDASPGRRHGRPQTSMSPSRWRITAAIWRRSLAISAATSSCRNPLPAAWNGSRSTTATAHR